MRVYRVAIAGYGFMGGKTYPTAIYLANMFLVTLGIQLKLVAYYARDRSKHELIKAHTGADLVSDNLDEVIAACDIFVNCLPNEQHEEPTIRAAKAGKHVVCEKPLGSTLAAAQAILAAVREAKVRSLCSYCYIGADAVGLGRANVNKGLIIPRQSWFTGWGNFEQDWAIFLRENWRYSFQVAGPGGILDDLLQHVLSVMFCWIPDDQVLTHVRADLQYANGDGKEITFVDGTDPSARSRAVDAATAALRFANGSEVQLHTSRFSRGHKAYSEIKLHGLSGAQKWELEDGHLLHVMQHGDDASQRGWTKIHCSNGEQGNWESVPGLTRGYPSYFANLFVRFALSISQDTDTPTYMCGGEPIAPFVPDFNFAVKLQKITDAMLGSGYNGGTWQAIAL